MVQLFGSVLVLLAAPVSAQILYGPSRAIDGDTLVIGDTHVRLHGIDAVESNQLCTRDEGPWECGKEAASFLADRVNGSTVQCQTRDRDVYGRDVSTCRVNGRDLSLWMVEAGYAVALRDFSETYVEAEERARVNRIGIWASQFQIPAEYRAEHPQSLLPHPKRSFEQPASNIPRVVRQEATQSFDAYYPNCAAARAAGAAPIRRGEPGYRPQLDADGDGIACEPYRGQ
ncbi:hypothetical protein GRI89_03275 [Altererythrobacter salegens]|uniref:TNase-like domain-containing protein n=1 Tax=Croceibacterium salegens TaxID=1737568 RepID=A0A6I4SRR7_9SPHN|nr:excalibur calcium-binding domain-containing protein [Croceibacterium salegens]MXO58563.1 hypothetical protein [Croceibacterium salegens]